MVDIFGQYTGDMMESGKVPAASCMRVCGNCGSRLFADAPQGLCSLCLFKTGLGSFETTGNEPDGEDDELLLEKEFDGYELLGQIGRGGQGVVYRAWQKSLSRTVALKVLALGQWAGHAHLKRFRLEAEAAARLDHPGIVPIHEVGQQYGCCYYTMNLVDGQSLDTVVADKPMPNRRAAELIAKVARAVYCAHTHGILHRDIKPGNILLDTENEPHLTDFGLARLIETESTITRATEVLGTPEFMAPEQASKSGKIACATDIYGIGAVLYFLLTGHPPFAATTAYETINLLLETEPRHPRTINRHAEAELCTICLKCLDKDPQHRYPSALALAEDLERWLRHEPILARRAGPFSRARKWVRRNPIATAFALSLAGLVASLTLLVSNRVFQNHPAQSGIAVLPFENLSAEMGNAYLVDGLQDDILTKLARIADLKVTSRSSVMPFRGRRDIGQIGAALRVSHILEGTVRQQGDELLVNARLVDTRNDRLVWADEYRTDVSGMLAIETTIARQVATRLDAHLSVREQAALDQRPSQDLNAYDLYLRATSLLNAKGCNRESLFQAIALLGRAIARDPGFVLAYCRLASAHDQIYVERYDHTAGRLSLAASALQTALQLNPNSGEAHLALATHLYLGFLDYPRAREELAIALQTMPNNARIYELSAYIDRKRGHWNEAVQNFERAIERDPQNKDILFWAAATRVCLRQYQPARELARRLLTLKVTNPYMRLLPAWIEFHERANPEPWHAALKKMLMSEPAPTGLARLSFLPGLYPRESAVATSVLRDLGDSTLIARGIGNVQLSRAYAKGMAALRKGDNATARAEFQKARSQRENMLRDDPEDALNLCALGLIDAALGRNAEALAEGRRAAELLPIEKDAINGAEVRYFYAAICAETGEQDLAIQALKVLAKLPAGISYGEISLDPHWDTLRRDERFEKIVASLAPKEI